MKSTTIDMPRTYQQFYDHLMNKPDDVATYETRIRNGDSFVYYIGYKGKDAELQLEKQIIKAGFTVEHCDENPATWWIIHNDATVPKSFNSIYAPVEIKNIRIGRSGYMVGNITL